MKVLVTGGAGMLGRSLVPALVGADHDVTVTDIYLSAPTPWGQSGPVITELDVRERSSIADAFADVRPDLVVHLLASGAPVGGDHAADDCAAHDCGGAAAQRGGDQRDSACLDQE